MFWIKCFIIAATCFLLTFQTHSIHFGGRRYHNNETVTYKMSVDVKCFGSNGLASLQPAFYWLSKHIRFVLGVEGIIILQEQVSKEMEVAKSGKLRHCLCGNKIKLSKQMAASSGQQRQHRQQWQQLNVGALDYCGLYYIHITIVIWWSSRVTLLL